MFRWITSRKLKSTWNDIDASPRQARGALEKIAQSNEAAVDKAEEQGKPPKSADLAMTIQAWLGVQLCDILLGNWEEAAKSEKRWRKHGEPSPEDLVKLCRTWLQESPDPLPDSAVRAYGAYFGLSEKHHRAELSGSVRSKLEELMTLPDDASRDHVLRAIDRARILYDEAPDVDWIQFHYGVSRYLDGDARQAGELIAEAVKSSPKIALWWTWLGRAEWRNGRRVIGRRAHLRAHDLEPTPKTAEEAGRTCTQSVHDPFTDRDGEQYVGKEPGEVGISLLLLATEQAPDSVSGWLALARGYTELKQYEKALEAVERLVQLKPDDVEAYCVRGEVLLAQGNRKEARESLKYAQGINANSPVVARLAGDLAFDDREFEAALQQYVKIPLLDWSDMAFRQRLARCHLEAGRPEDVLEVATEKDANNAEFRLARGRAQGRLGRWREAMKTLESADWRLMGDEYRYYTAAALAANERYNEAETVFSELSRDDNWRDRARRQLGHIAVAQNDDKTAEQYYVGEKNGAVTHEDLGRLLLVRGKPSAASTHFRKSQQRQCADGGQATSVTRLGYAFSECLRSNAGPAEELMDDADLAPWAHEFRGHVMWERHQTVDALEAYEQATGHRDRVPTQVLARLAEGYLQLSRFREALPHLVELSRRRPDNEKVSFNLAYCRYHLGRKLFRRGSWETARAEWRRVRHVLEPLNPDLAKTIERWEAEAAWRQACTVLQKERWGELPRTLTMIDTYRERDTDPDRWDVAKGLAEAFSKNHTAAAEAFDSALKSLPEDPAVHLGLGLSRQLSGESAAAQKAFAKVLELTTGEEQQFLNLACRFSMAMSHAEEKQWKEAAVVLEPLIGHPLIRQSGGIADTDVAQAVVAYYGLSGDTKKTEELAGKHLKGSGATSDILIGIVQADSGDYEGAVNRLSRAFKQEENPAVRDLLVSCMVCLSAKFVLDGKLSDARQHCKRALKGDRHHKLAKQLLSAIDFADNLANLDLTQVDRAIKLCEPLLKSSKSVQLVRTLAILYHRHAIGEEARGRSIAKDWGRCVLFWTNEIIDSNKFWDDFVEEFNQGRKGRDQIKTDALTKLRAGLRGKMAKLHVEYLLMALDAKEKSARELHLRMIRDWNPEHDTSDLVEQLCQRANAAAGELSKLTAGGQVNPNDLDTIRLYARQALDALELAHKLAPERKDIAKEYRGLKKACFVLRA